MIDAELRRLLRQKLAADTAEWTAALTVGTGKSLDELRLAQGVLRGIEIAEARLDEAWREANAPLAETPYETHPRSAA